MKTNAPKVLHNLLRKVKIVVFFAHDLRQNNFRSWACKNENINIKN